MNVAELEALPAFALLAPGYVGDERGWTLLTGLTPSPEGSLVYVPFEARALDGARCFAGDGRRLQQLELTEAPALRVAVADGHFAAAVAKIRDDIAAGDVYQVCLTLRATLHAALPGRAPAGSQLLSLLCARGVPPFAAWVRFPDGTELVSASPELLLRVDGRTARSEPMKGTAASGEAALLLASEKDRAELAMITDLVRNDLTPVCVPRSVRVVDPRRVLHLPYASQTVSVVEGTLREDVTALQALDALHPGGSVTGAPKPAALERLRALEGTPRGAYCGALGLRSSEQARFALLIRTAERHREGWTYGVGSGIVWDSRPDTERAELAVKLRPLQRDAL